jgi:Putative esterase
VLEPQGTFFFLLLMVAFAGLLVWMALTKQIVFRVLAACLAFIPAMVFGIAAVNKYYDYYQTWGALFTDLSGTSGSAAHISAASLRSTHGSVRTFIASSSNAALDGQIGYLFNTTVTGPRSHISRTVYVYLPPQYFWKSYANYRFPAIELLHGSPGKPTAWVGALDLIPIYQGLLASHQARPAVLVMPDTDGGYQYSLQCLNDPRPHGLQDMTWVGQEVPDWVAANLRVQPPGPSWGIAGYSEGGYCAANIALNYSGKFGFSGVLSGYFKPAYSQVPANGKPNGTPIHVFVYAHRAHLAMLNTPEKYILNFPLAAGVPQFFIVAGAEDAADVRNAEYFRQELLTRNPDALPVDIISGGGHQGSVWRKALTPLLTWMTREQAQYLKTTQADARLAAIKRGAEQKAARQAAAHRVHTAVRKPAALTSGPGTARGVRD